MILTEYHNNVFFITLNRIEKHNAFNEELLDELQTAIESGLKNDEVKALVLKANGRFFSAGADLNSMRNAATLNPEENTANAQQLADVLFLWHQSPKPTLCLIQGSAFGGALGFIAASDVAIATPEAKFCFSEAKLGLIPAVISPYILETIGFKPTKRLFLSAETFDAKTAKTIKLIDEVTSIENLQQYANDYLQQWLCHETETLQTIKKWLFTIQNQKINHELTEKTAKKLASIRNTPIAKKRLHNFLEAKKI